ncbi:MAG: TIGR02300 family protein [Xanthobacteraceae bacterium]
MAKAELGTKRICPETGRKFYDLNKNPVISPYTGKVVPVETYVSRSRAEPAAAARAPAPVEEVATPEPAEAEFVSLEDADAEASGASAKKPGEGAEAEIEDEEVEIDDESLDDAAFIEETEEEDADVTDIIGGDIENEEEG